MTNALPITDILNVAKQASGRIMSLYKGGKFKVYQKEDNTPVTDADLAANEVLTAGLAGAADIPILSEEKFLTDEELAGAKRFWVIDPLDGTRGFIEETDDFAINIAILEDSVAVFGMIYLPVTGEAYYGEQGRGAFKLTGEGEWQKIRVNKPDDLPQNIIASRHHASSRVQQIVDNMTEPGFVSIGSAIKFAMIATGAATVYPRFMPTGWWDTAAGQCLVEEAGGVVLDGKLQPLRYTRAGVGKDFLNPGFIACAYTDKSWCEPWQKLNEDTAQNS